MIVHNSDFSKVRKHVSSYLSTYSFEKQVSPPIIVIAGPTASGKSFTAIKLAKLFNGYIINADSQQVYRELKIGTAQPIPDSVSASLPNIPSDCWRIDDIEHYLYGYQSITSKYNLALYKKDVEKILEIKATQSSTQIPFLVGGTGLYIDAVVFNYTLDGSNDSFDITPSREKLQKKSVSELHKIIGDKISLLNRSDQRNPHRLIRFIERGMKKSIAGKNRPHTYIVLSPSEDDLETKITKRVDYMLKNGLLEENIALRKASCQKSLLSSIGYTEFNSFLDGTTSMEHVRKQIILHTKQYAKRQITWFKRRG